MLVVEAPAPHKLSTLKTARAPPPRWCRLPMQSWPSKVPRLQLGICALSSHRVFRMICWTATISYSRDTLLDRDISLSPRIALRCTHDACPMKYWRKRPADIGPSAPAIPRMAANGVSASSSTPGLSLAALWRHRSVSYPALLRNSSPPAHPSSPCYISSKLPSQSLHLLSLHRWASASLDPLSHGCRS